MSSRSPTSRKWSSTPSASSWHSFIEALAIVLFVSFVALGWRTGIVVAMSVPLVLAIVFIVMNAMSLDLHRITLGALIIALGLLVDDAIIAVEMMVVKMEQGWDRIHAGVLCLGIYRVSDAHGDAGHGRWLPPHRLCQFGGRRICRGIFWIVSIALVASWFVAVIFTPYMAVKLLPNITVLHTHDPHAVYETRGCIAFFEGMIRGASITGSRWCWQPSACSCSRSSASAMCSSVLPAVRAPGAVPAVAAARRQRLQRHREVGENRGNAAPGRQGYRDLYLLCRPGLAALLARPQSAAAERGLCPRS